MKLKGWRKMSYWQTVTKKESWGTILMSDKIDFKTKIVARNKEDFTLIQGSVVQEDTTFINIDTPNNRTPKHKKQKWNYWITW